MSKHLLRFMLLFVITGKAVAIEEPKYDVLLSEGQFEIRKYAPKLIAEVIVEGDMDEASSKGFKLIANFIFGNNQAANQTSSEKIAMTAPVTVEPQSVKIAMTAPVTVEPQSIGSSPTVNMETAKQWRVDFVMPSQYTLSSIPKPSNEAVKLKEIPSKSFVALKYSGFNTVARVQSKTLEVIAWASEKKLKVIGTPQLSRYDPPWTLPMFRRNEILIEVASP